LVEHVLGKDEVTSSILVVGSKRYCSERRCLEAAFVSKRHWCGVGVTTESATH
jgi:hypothetical protein